MNLSLVQEPVTGTDILNSPVRVEPSVVSLSVGISERFTHVLRIHANVGEFPTLLT